MQQKYIKGKKKALAIAQMTSPDIIILKFTLPKQVNK